MPPSALDDHREAYGVEPICRVLPIAPSTYYAARAQRADPALRSARAQSDDALRLEIQRVWDEDRSVYGAKKVWKQLKREDFTVARCTVARLMREMGLRGVTRGRRVRTTVPADLAERPLDLAERPLDLVERGFTAERPNQLWVSDLTYVATWRGFVYVAFWADTGPRSTCSRAGSSGGACRTRCGAIWHSTRWSRPSASGQSATTG